MIASLIKKYANLLTALCIIAAAYAAPYLVPGDPDALVFRDGIFPAILLLVTAYPISAALKKHALRDLIYGCAFALVFSFFLGLGGELMFYEGLLPGIGSLIRRFAVPCMVTPLLGVLCSYVFAHPCRLNGASGRQLPYLFYFLVLALSYTATFLAFFPGIVNYDFQGEIVQYMTGEYLASHPIFHTVLLGALYQLGTALFGSATGGAAVYSVFQMAALSAMFAWCLQFIQKRVPLWATLLLTAAMAFLPFHSVLAVSTVKDALFTGLCAMLCVTLWEIAEDPDAFIASLTIKLRFFLIALFMSLLRHNAVFAVIPAIIAIIALCRSTRMRALVACAVTLFLCFCTPRFLQFATNATDILSSELMSVPCQQLMRTAATADDLTQEEQSEISAWFSDAIHRYRPTCADPAKGGNFDLARYSERPEEYWSMYLKYAKRYPRIYIEAFFFNCMGIWYPDDTTHAHTLDGEDWDYVYLRTGNNVPDMVGEVKAHSYLPAYRDLLRDSTHHSNHEDVPLYAQLFKPATYAYLLLLLTMLLLHRRERRLALCTLPVWGIILSLFFSACILVRYAYPIMTCTPMLLLLIVFSDKRAAQ